jgi:amino acid transporter
VWAFIITFVLLLRIVEAGLVGDLVIFVLCLGPMMIDEGTEVYSCANALSKAAERHISFGQGDISVLLILKKTIGRMSAYYLLLSVLFAALFFAMPYAYPAILLAFSQFISLTIYSTIGIPVIAPLVAVALLVVVWLAVFETSKRVKAVLFGFASSHPADWETSEEAAIARQPFHEH